MEEKTTEEKAWEQKSQCECFYFLKNKFFEILRILKTKNINFLNKFYSFIDKTIIYFKYLYLSIKENSKIFIIFILSYGLLKAFLLNYILIFWAFFDKELLIIFLLLLLSILIFFWKKIYWYFKTLIISKRSDIFMTYVFIFHIIYNSFNLEKILYIQYLVLFLIINFIRFLFEQNIKKWLLISDKSIDWEELPDELWFQENADNFANIVYNNWSIDNQVFWLVAEWWAWKTSFLNLFKNNALIKDDSIYIEFNPWYYENEKDLLEKFLENIISNLKSKKYYLPKLNKNFNAFLKLLDDNSQKFFWLNFSLSSNKTLEEIKEDINDSLKSVNKKIIIVIDDLDRIPSKRLKEIFKIVDLCRNFHNTSYILCYDPLNFNSIDDNLVQTYSQENTYNSEYKRFEENLNIHTQKVDNSEITRYMSKIITVYYPLIIDKKKLRDYFVRIFTDDKYSKLNIDEDSKNNIELSIDNLFLYDNFRLWWKYYSNIRLVKRLYNLFLIFNAENSEINFFNTDKWVNFANFFKLSVLMLNYNDIFLDINNEVELVLLNNDWLTGFNFTFLISFDRVMVSLNDNDDKYKIYLKTLTLEKRELLKDLFPIYDKSKSSDEYLLRDFTILSNYLSILKTYWNNSKENFNKLLTEFKNYKIDFDNYFINNNDFSIFYLDDINFKDNSKFNDYVIDKLVSYNEPDKLVHSVKYFNFILKYSWFYTYTLDFRFEFTTDIIKVLSSSFRSWNNFIREIREFIYWKDNKNSFVDTIINFTKADLKLDWLLQLLLFIRWLHKDNWGYYNTFMELLKTDKIKTFEEVRTEYCDFLFNKLKEHKYFNDKAIFSEMLDFEIKNDTNQITYWLQNLLWSLSDEYKKEFAWYLKTWFENNINFFLNYFLRYVTSNWNEVIWTTTNKIEKINLSKFYIDFDKDYLKTFLNKKSSINNSLNLDFKNNFSEPLIYPSNLYEVFELFEKSLIDDK